MKPIIGIICRNYFSATKRNINVIYDDMISAIIKSGGIPVGIPLNEDIMDYLDIVNGVIFQGGDDINNHNLEVIKVLKDRDIPTLGICLGMQEMFYQDNLIDVSNHKIGGLYVVNINRGTLLYKILGKDKILVNSRHQSGFKNTDYVIDGVSLDGVIEAIEDDSLKFFLGLEWHPENLYNIDLNSKKIFDYFIKICKN